MANYLNFSKNKQAIQSGKIYDPSSTYSHKVVKNNPLSNINEWEKQVWFDRTHLDVFIEEYFSTEEHPIKFFPFQKVIIRQLGNCFCTDDVESRGLGKTFKVSYALFALAILYPQSPIMVVSKTAKQAILTIKYIDALVKKSPNAAREVDGKISLTKDYGLVQLRNGSTIEALAMNTDGSNIRGLRRKIIYIDEAGWVKTDVIKSVLMPILQYKRDVYWKWKDKGFEDYQSKIIQSSSAYLKSCDYFKRFKQSLTDIKNGDDNKFVCALPYTVGVEYGIIDKDFVLNQKRDMPLSAFEMEWCAKFIGSAEGAYFPYELTESCRTLENIEIIQPKKSKSRYIITLDIATSELSGADNACLSVIKFHERFGLTFLKSVVNIRSYHGKSLEFLAGEVRKYFIRFPNTEKIIIDINSIGEGILYLLNSPFVDENNNEYPPLLLDDSEANNGLKIIRGIKADNRFNGRIATATRLFLENKSLQIPLPSNVINRDLDIINKPDCVVNEEFAIFVEADAYQFEMGNIVTRLTNAGNIVYETTSYYLKKDRYISIGMGLEYIYELEERNRNKWRDNEEEMCIGAAYAM